MMQQGFHFRRLNSAHVCDVCPLLLFSILRLQAAADRHTSPLQLCVTRPTTINRIQSWKLFIQTCRRSNLIQASAKPELRKDFIISVTAGIRCKNEAKRLTPFVPLIHGNIAPNNSQKSHKEPCLERPIFYD